MVLHEGSTVLSVAVGIDVTAAFPGALLDNLNVVARGLETASEHGVGCMRSI